jgi:hypothetical protein
MEWPWRGYRERERGATHWNPKHILVPLENGANVPSASRRSSGGSEFNPQLAEDHISISN